MGACVSVTSSVCSAKAKAFEFNERSLDRGSSLCSRRLSLVAHVVPRDCALVFLAFPSSLVFFERRPRPSRLASPRLNDSSKRTAAAAAAQRHTCVSFTKT